MSVILQAPYPALQTTSILPSPQFSNTDAGVVKLKSIVRSMDGTRRTYVQSTPDERLNFQFSLTRMKSLELRAFIQSYFDKRIKMTTHEGEVWLVRLINDPFEFIGERRAATAREVYTVSLELRGVKVT